MELFCQTNKKSAYIRGSASLFFMIPKVQFRVELKIFYKEHDGARLNQDITREYILTLSRLRDHR